MLSNSILDVNCWRASLMSVWARYSTRMLRYDTSNDSLIPYPPCTWWQSPGAGGAASCAELAWCQPTGPRCPWWRWCPVAACRSCPAPGGRRTGPGTLSSRWGYSPWPGVWGCDFWWSPDHSCCHREDSVWWANFWKSKHLNDQIKSFCPWDVWMLLTCCTPCEGGTVWTSPPGHSCWCPPPCHCRGGHQAGCALGTHPASSGAGVRRGSLLKLEHFVKISHKSTM